MQSMQYSPFHMECDDVRYVFNLVSSASASNLQEISALRSHCKAWPYVCSAGSKYSKCSTSPGSQVPRTTEAVLQCKFVARDPCHSSTMNQPSMRLHGFLPRCAKRPWQVVTVDVFASKVRRQKSKSKVSRGKLKMIILTKWRNNGETGVEIMSGITQWFRHVQT